MAVVATLTLDGDKTLQRKLKRLIGPELLRVIKPAARKAMTRMRSAAKKRVGKKSGDTRRAIVTKQVVYKTDGNVLTMVGVRRATFKSRVRKAFKPGFVTQAESNLEHLLELGHLIVKGGKLGQGGRVVGFVRPHPFLAPAWRANKNRAQVVYARGVETGIHKLAAKGGFKA